MLYVDHICVNMFTDYYDCSFYSFRALDKRQYLMIFFLIFSTKPYVVTPHLNCLNETVQMRGHNIWFYAELTKISLIISKYSLLSRALNFNILLARS